MWTTTKFTAACLLLLGCGVLGLALWPLLAPTEHIDMGAGTTRHDVQSAAKPEQTTNPIHTQRAQGAVEFRVLLPWDRRSAAKLTNIPPRGRCDGGSTVIYRTKAMEAAAPAMLLNGSLDGIVFDSIGVMKRDEAIANLSSPSRKYKVGLWNTENWRGRLREWSSKYRVRWLNKTGDPQWWASFDAVASFETTSQVMIPYAANPLYPRLEAYTSSNPPLPQLGMAMHVASNCHTDYGAKFAHSFLGQAPLPDHLKGKMPKHRAELVSALISSGLAVGSFGLCGAVGNDLAEHCRAEADKSLRKYCVMRRFPLYLAFENSRFPDYVTEKLLEPLAVGVIPVYWGAPNVADLLSADHMIIDASKFETVGQLALYLRCVIGNATAASYYRDWRSRLRWGPSVADAGRRSSFPICQLVDAMRKHRHLGQPPPIPVRKSLPPLTDQGLVPCLL